MVELTSARKKVDWAKSHIHKAKEISDPFFKTHFYKLAARRQGNGKKGHFLIVKAADAVPPELGLCIGDAAHNLRSALDHIAYALAKPAAGKEKYVCFPLFDAKSKFIENRGKCLPGVPPAAVKAIERLQPYPGRHAAKPKLLGRIQAIDNWDKHRSLLVTGAGRLATKILISHIRPASVVSHRIYQTKRIQKNAILARFQLGETPTQENMDVRCELTLAPVFDKRMPNMGQTPILNLLDDAARLIESEIIPTFEAFL